MDEEDQILQNALRAVEMGTPIEIVLARLPEGSDELADLVLMASYIRSMPHPDPNPAAVQAVRSRIVPSARKTAPTNRSKLPGLTLFPLRIALAVLLLLILLAGGAGVYAYGPQSARAAVLTNVNGLVEIGPSASAGLPATSGAKLTAGQQITTFPSSKATLVFSDGSSIVIGPDSSLLIDQLSGSWDGALNLRVRQQAGSANYMLFHPDNKSKYSILSPSSQASIDNASLTVNVLDSQQVQYSVIDGQANVTSRQGHVQLTPGQTVLSSTDGTLNAPAFSFSLVGSLDAAPGGRWAVNGFEFSISSQTFMINQLQVGQVVNVLGQIQNGGEWQATAVTSAFTQETRVEFTGVVEARDGDGWKIGGKHIRTADLNQASQDIIIGSKVQVVLSALSQGVFQAANIEVLQAAPIATANPQLGFASSGMAIQSCEASDQISTMVLNRATQSADIANRVELGYSVEDGTPYIGQVQLSPDRFESILPGQSLSITINLTYTPSWAEAQQGSTIRLRIFVAAEANRPDHTNEQLNLVVKRNCAGQNGAGGKQTTPEETKTCTKSPNPAAANLAATYNVPVDEILGYFCQGIGLGEIDLAYNLAQTYQVNPADILSQRLAGESWGAIRNQLEGRVKKTPEKKKP